MFSIVDQEYSVCAAIECFNVPISTRTHVYMYVNAHHPFTQLSGKSLPLATCCCCHYNVVGTNALLLSTIWLANFLSMPCAIKRKRKGKAFDTSKQELGNWNRIQNTICRKQQCCFCLFSLLQDVCQHWIQKHWRVNGDSSDLPNGKIEAREESF